MARCGCGGGSCACFVEAGTGTTVTGTGSSTNPFVVSADDPSCSVVRPCISAGNGASYSSASGVVSARPSTDAGNLITFGGDGGLFADVDCAEVRGCLSEGDGINYDPVTGEISARPSTDAGNNLTFGGDGGLFVGSTTGTVNNGCGIDGDGSLGDPVRAAVEAWPYPCPVDANAGLVYCDSTGKLRGEPRGRTDFVQQINSTLFPNTPVPAGATVTIVTDNLNVSNADTCRPAYVMIETEVDVDITYPANSGAVVGIAADDMIRYENRGTSQANELHWQIAKTFRATIPAGGAIVDPIDVRVGGGFGGATYSRVQVIHRAFIFNL